MVGRMLLLYAGIGVTELVVADFVNYVFTGESIIVDAVEDVVETIKTKVTGRSSMDDYDDMDKIVIEADWEIIDIS